jgi:hypothetical protein
MMLVLEHKRGGDLWLLEKYTIIVFLYKSFEIFMGILHVKTPHDLGCIDESLHMLYILESKSKGMYVGLEYSHFTSTNKRSGI